jgi:hypothetical protein
MNQPPLKIWSTRKASSVPLFDFAPLIYVAEFYLFSLYLFGYRPFIRYLKCKQWTSLYAKQKISKNFKQRHRAIYSALRIYKSKTYICSHLSLLQIILSFLVAHCSRNEIKHLVTRSLYLTWGTFADFSPGKDLAYFQLDILMDFLSIPMRIPYRICYCYIITNYQYNTPTTLHFI